MTVNRRNFIKVSVASASMPSRLRSNVASLQFRVGDGDVLQSAIDHVHSSGGGTIVISVKDIKVENPIILRPGVYLRGDGAAPKFTVSRPNMRMFDGHGGEPKGAAGLINLSMVGPAALDNDLGSERDRLVVVGPFADTLCEDLDVSRSRWVSLTALGTRVAVRGCKISEGYRDGIQVYNGETVIIENNSVSKVADDGISILRSRTSTGSENASFKVINNRLDHCTGIKVLGGRNVVIRYNRLYDVLGYGIFLGCDPNFHEGMIDEDNILVEQNTIDGLSSLAAVSDQIGIAGIAVMGCNDPITKISNLSIIRNTIRMRWGEGNLWWTSGQAAQKESKPNNHIGMPGILFLGGDYRDTLIHDNRILGEHGPVVKVVGSCGLDNYNDGKQD